MGAARERSRYGASMRGARRRLGPCSDPPVGGVLSGLRRHAAPICRPHCAGVRAVTTLTIHQRLGRRASGNQPGLGALNPTWSLALGGSSSISSGRLLLVFCSSGGGCASGGRARVPGSWRSLALDRRSCRHSRYCFPRYSLYYSPLDRAAQAARRSAAPERSSYGGSGC